MRRRAGLVAVVLALLFLLPGSELDFPPDVPVVRADPSLSGASPVDIVNGDFSGTGLGEVGTPPTNNALETAGGSVGSPPSNNGFGTGDFTDWTQTGTPTIQSGGPTGDYARLATSSRASTTPAWTT